MPNHHHKQVPVFKADLRLRVSRNIFFQGLAGSMKWGNGISIQKQFVPVKSFSLGWCYEVRLEILTLLLKVIRFSWAECLWSPLQRLFSSSYSANYLMKTVDYTKQKGFSAYVDQALMVLFLFLKQENEGTILFYKIWMNHLTA